MQGPNRREQGQGTVEWIGLLLLVALLFAALLAAGMRVPVGTLARAIAARIICAASLGTVCGEKPGLAAVYGRGVARLVRRHAPSLAYEAGMRALPVDFRRCRAARCSNGRGEGTVTRVELGRASRRLRARRRLPPAGAPASLTAPAAGPATSTSSTDLLRRQLDPARGAGGGTARVPPRRLGGAPVQDRRRRQRRPAGVLPPRLQLRAGPGQLGLGRRHRAAAKPSPRRSGPARAEAGAAPRAGCSSPAAATPATSAATFETLPRHPRRPHPADPAGAAQRARRRASRSVRPGASRSGATQRPREPADIAAAPPPDQPVPARNGAGPISTSAAIRRAPSRRIVSPFSIGFSTTCSASRAYSSGRPSRDGNGIVGAEGVARLLRQRRQQRRVEEARARS